VEDPASRAIAAAELALQAARDGEVPKAKIAANEAKQAAGGVTDAAQQSTLYTALAKAWANSPLWEESRTAAQSAASSADAIADPQAKASALAAASGALLASGAKTEALAMADRALAVIVAPQGLQAKTAALAALGRIREARRTAESIGEPVARMGAFTAALRSLPTS
jgi:hypothetical protein